MYNREPDKADVQACSDGAKELGLSLQEYILLCILKRVESIDTTTDVML